MPSIRRQRPWTINKPPDSALINWGHPIVNNAFIVWRPSGAGLSSDELGRPLVYAGTNSTSWVMSPYGPGINFTSTSSYYHLTLNTPSNSCTILTLCYVDLSAVEGSAFGSAAANPNRLQAHMPYDGTIYWDFGSTAAGGRITWTPSAGFFSSWHAMVFRAGPVNGMQIFSDGVVQATQGTANTRTGSAEDFRFNSGAVDAGENMGFVLFIGTNDELDNSTIASWFVNPFQMFQPAASSWLFPSAAASGGSSYGNSSSMSSRRKALSGPQVTRIYG